MNAVTAAKRTLDATEGWFPREVDPAHITPAELALAGLARCRRLLWAMIQLHGESSDLAGGHARALYETWLSSVYSLFGGDEARDRLVANDLHEKRRIAKVLVKWLSTGEPVPETKGLLAQAEAVLAEPEPTIGKLGLKDQAIAVRRLATAAGQPDSDLYEKAYAFLYGPESYMSAHGGLDSMSRHVDGRTREIRADGWSYTGEDRRLEVGIAMVTGLGNQLADALALDRSAFDSFAKDWRPA